MTVPGAGPDQSAEAEDAAAAGMAERIVDGTRERLEALDHLPTAEHVAVYDELHRELSSALSALDRED
ncbi:hypothetical protein ACFOVU_01260 [Nocardiopsis sediminis]|uniref:Uncharacterized protein n=1 Tax=Nocardiopsis sediminis TaxID=1778267 RepID=A0ABV8FHY9_9ACTN